MTADEDNEPEELNEPSELEELESRVKKLESFVDTVKFAGSAILLGILIPLAGYLFGAGIHTVFFRR